MELAWPLRVFLAIAYTTIYFVAGVLFATGGGHGTMIFVWPLFTWVFYLVAFLVGNKLSRRSFVVLMFLHYAWVLIFLYTLILNGFELDPNDISYWKSETTVVVFTSLLYVAGQLVAWTYYFNDPGWKEGRRLE
jgi:hypothetical protein